MMIDVEGPLQKIQERGWCVLPDVIPASKVSGVRQCVEHTVHIRTQAEGIPDSVSTLAVSGLVNYDQSFVEFLADEKLLSINERLLRSHFRVSFTTAIVTKRGNRRGGWHADWPFDQMCAGRLPAPYPDFIGQITAIWMLTDFEAENGSTIVLNGSHRTVSNPTSDLGIDAFAPIEGEVAVTGAAGSVLVFDSRLWHAAGKNLSDQNRISFVVRYAPKWLNLDVLKDNSDERKRLVDEVGGQDASIPLVPENIFEKLPDKVKPLFRHWVDRIS